MGFFDRLFGKNSNRSSGAGSAQQQATEGTIEIPQGVPYELLKVSGNKAVAKALELRSAWSGTFIPVILGGKDFGMLETMFEETTLSAEQLIEQSRSVNLVSRFDEWLHQNDEEGTDDPLAYVTNPEDWNKQPGPNEIVSVREVLTSKFYKGVWIAKVPTPNPFEIPAYLKLGDWNECPPSQDHVAVWRYWQEKYGAEILCATGDVIEATVKCPPSGKEDCYALAREQFAYCSDIVTQGVGSVDALAKTLQNAKYWYFWWD